MNFSVHQRDFLPDMLSKPVPDIEISPQNLTVYHDDRMLFNCTAISDLVVTLSVSAILGHR